MKRPAVLALAIAARGAEPPLTLAREGNMLLIRGSQIPGKELPINYLEAYCRAGSTDADWVKHTVIKHRSELISASEDGRVLKLRDTLEDGVTVEHTITAGADEVDFRLVAHNPTATRSEAHWAQPCVRLSKFTGYDEKTIPLSGTAANLNVAAGDVLAWQSDSVGTGLADPGGLVTIAFGRTVGR